MNELRLMDGLMYISTGTDGKLLSVYAGGIRIRIPFDQRHFASANGHLSELRDQNRGPGSQFVLLGDKNDVLGGYSSSHSTPFSSGSETNSIWVSSAPTLHNDLAVSTAGVSI
jgi:hypothetical protein